MKLKKSYIIVLVLVLLLGFVLFVGTYSYTNISRVVSDIEAATISDGKLVQTKNLLREISQAENSVKTYSLTKNSTYLDQYYTSIHVADDMMNGLMDSDSGMTEVSQLDLNLLDSLITKKFEILNSYLDLQNDYRVGIALDKVIQSIEKPSESTPEKDKEPTKHPNSPRSFIKKLFPVKEKQKEKVEINRIDEEIKAIKSQEDRINQSMVGKEIDLIMKDKEVTQQIDSIIYDFELAENQRVSLRSEKAAKEIRIINQQITLLFVNAGVLVLFVLLLIVRYVRANNRFGIALEKAKTQAEQLAETKERFLNNMSHEIRTPMNAIAGFIKQLAKSPLNNQQKEQVEIISKSSDYLLHIVDEVLVFNKLQNKQAKVEIKGFELHELVKDLHKVLEPSARKKGIQFKTNIHSKVPKIIKTDPYKLNQVLINVIGNAIKFTTKGRVSLSVSQRPISANKVEINFLVEDTGIGMTKEQMERIFDEFEQAEVTTTRQFGGTGLGLSITKKIVQLLDGSITVDSQKGVGSSFDIIIPVEMGDEADVFVLRESEDASKTLKDLSILVVDDEVYNRKLLLAILSKHSVNVTEAENGIEAFEEVKRNKYDVVLMDTRMPVLDGIEATKKIRACMDKIVATVPIIAISAAVSESDQATYKQVGMNGFLPKPFKESDLIRQIGTVTGQLKPLPTGKVTPSLEANADLDFRHLSDLSNGDAHFFLDMLETFVQTITKGLASIQKSIDQSDIDMVAEHAHRIASPCKHLNANALYACLKKIENGIRNDEITMKEVTELYAEVKELAQQVLTKVNAEIKSQRDSQNE